MAPGRPFAPRNPGTQFNRFEAVKAFSADDVWAVGQSGGVHNTTLVEHWGGVEWTVVATPHLGKSELFSGIGGSSSADLWAGGYYYNPSGRSLAEHWDGTSWHRVHTPNPGRHGGIFNDVASAASDDTWAVGSAGTRPFTARWDGRVWSTVPSPSQGTGNNVLYSAAATSATNAWAGGVFYLPPSSVEQTLTMRWDGAAWSLIPSPNLGAASIVYGMAAPDDDQAWAVGYGVADSVYMPLVEHFC